MNLRDRLDIVIITYNRREYLKTTFEQLFSISSPVKDYDITVIDNNSDDGTGDLVKEYSENFPNLKYVKNYKNIGGCPNIAKAFAEFSQKDYIWLLGDNDFYDWSSWSEIEDAVINSYDAILTQNFGDSAGACFYSASLISGCIYKTSLITETVISTMYENIHLIFPHLSIMAKVINDKKKVFVVRKSVVKLGTNPNQHLSFTRGINADEVLEERKYIFSQAAYIMNTRLIKDKKLRHQIISESGFEYGGFEGLLKIIIIQNKFYYNNYFGNLLNVFKMLSFNQRLLFLKIYLEVNFSWKNYRFYELFSEEDWLNYFEKAGEQNYIEKLAKKFKNKKILLYGAGLTANVILKNFDLSKFNIVGISDRKFLDDTQTFYGLKTIKPENMCTLDFDVIIFTMKLYEKIAESFKNSGIKKPMLSIIKKSKKYPMRF